MMQIKGPELLNLLFHKLTIEKTPQCMLKKPWQSFFNISDRAQKGQTSDNRPISFPTTIVRQFFLLNKILVPPDNIVCGGVGGKYKALIHIRTR